MGVTGVPCLAPFVEPVSPGNMIIACCLRMLDAAIVAGDTTDSLGHFYEQAVVQSGDRWIAIHYARVTAGGACEVALADTDPVQPNERLGLIVGEFAGLTPREPPTEGSAALYSPFPSMAADTGELLLTEAGVLVGVLMADATVTVAGADAPGELLVPESPITGFSAQYRIRGGGGPVSLAWTTAEPVGSFMCASGFKAEGRDAVFPSYAQFPRRAFTRDAPRNAPGE